MQFGTRDVTRRLNISNVVQPNAFSLLEIIVVIAVLSILLAISLPLLFSLVDTATARAAQQSLVDIYKSCQIKRLLGDKNALFIPSKINGYIFSAVPDDAEVFNTASLADLPSIPRRTKCMDESTGNLNNFIAIYENPIKFPKFFIYSAEFNRYCQTGSLDQYPNTFDAGCKGVVAIGDQSSTNNSIGFWN